MPTTKKTKPNSSNIIGSVSKLVGTVVGTTVVTSKRVIRTVKSSNKGPSEKTGKKTEHTPTPVKKKKKTVRKAAVKTPKTKKKKVVKRKGTGSSSVSKVSKKTPAKSPAKRKKSPTAKKKKSTTAKKKTTHRKTKKTTRSVELSRSPEGLISEIDKRMNVPSGELEIQL